MKKASKKKPNKKILTDNSLWTKPYIYIIIIALANILVFSQTSSFDFVNIDDGSLIYENPLIIDDNISYSEVFQSKKFTPHYKPITFLTWKYQYNTFGSNPSSFHTINWILHVINSIILFLIGIKIFKVLYEDYKMVLLSAFVLTLLFSINPLRIESVAWATERKDVLFSLFFLLSWYSYFLFIDKNKYAFLILGAFFYLLSGLSKSMGITLIIVLFLTDIWYNRKSIGKLFVEKAPYLIVFVGLLYLFGLFGSGTKEASDILIASSEKSGQLTTVEFVDNLPLFMQWLLSASFRFVAWLIHSLVPINTSVSYSADEMFGFLGYSLLLFPIIVIALYFLAWKKSTKLVLGGLLFFGITLSPVLTYTEVGQGTFLSDRYTYIPSIGIFLIVVYLINKWSASNTKKHALTAGILLFFIFTSLNNIGNWKNSETLFTHAIEISPTSAVAHLNLGLYYRVENQMQKALNTYNNGIKTNPNYPNLYRNRGKIYFDQNKMDLALGDFNKSLALLPNELEVLSNRGVCYAATQQWDKCFEDLNTALEINPNHLTSIYNRGFAYYSSNNFEEAKNDFLLYVKLNSNNPEVYNLLGLVYAQLKDFNQANTYHSQAVQLNPNSGQFYLNRSYSFYHLGDYSNALLDAQSAMLSGQKVNEDYLNMLR